MSRSAVIFGATGLIGSSLVQLLNQHTEFEKVYVCNRKKTFESSGKITELVIQYDALDNEMIPFYNSDIFCCLGTTIKKVGYDREAFKKVDLIYPLTIGKLAKEKNAASLLVVSALGANKNARIFYNRVKGQMEEGLSALGLESLKIFRPSLLLGKRIEKRTGEGIGLIISKLVSPLLLGNLKKYRPIQAKDVAIAMMKIALKSEKGKHIYEGNTIQLLADEVLA